ncbi:hypothetical protein C2G38_2146623 [Gigaspora rosea]|uniref:Uncharacterized protein n=1 Tax=Gigaspora rosea TaxID=44941 RepID=A0A397UGA5_9GLOM|nr:hypothetical protein C2G38_2146623 [Gigaspora rosea]
MLEIGALRQGVYKSVPSFWAKIQKYGDQLGYTPAQKKPHFLSRVRPDIRDEIYRIGQTKPINDIIDSLAKLELHYGILQQAPSQPRHAPIAPAIPDVISQQLQTQVPAPQTVEPVKQPRGSPSTLQTEEDDNEDEEGGYNEEENRWHAPSQSKKKQVSELSQPKTYNELLPKLSPAMRKMWWKADKPSDFAIKGNSKLISESLGWYTDVPISVKDKDGMTWIRKVQGILDPNKNQFQMKLHRKTYTIPTFSKALEVNEPEQQVSDMHDGEDLKKNITHLKSDL